MNQLFERLLYVQARTSALAACPDCMHLQIRGWAWTRCKYTSPGAMLGQVGSSNGGRAHNAISMDIAHVLFFEILNLHLIAQSTAMLVCSQDRKRIRPHIQPHQLQPCSKAVRVPRNSGLLSDAAMHSSGGAAQRIIS